MHSEVLQVVTDTDRRGAQVFAVDLEEGLRKLGWIVRTVALAPGGAGGLDLDVLGPSRRGPRTMLALCREMRTARVVVGHGSTTLFACAAAGLAVRTPFVYRQISDSIFWASTRWRKRRVTLALSRATHVVALSSGAAQTLSAQFGVATARIHVVPNGVPPSRFQPPSNDARQRGRDAFGLDRDCPTVAFIGALVEEKGADIAIRAIANIQGSQLVVVGDGPERAHLEELARDIAPGRVVFTGSVSDPLEALSAADVVALPSRGGDSMPAALIEAGLSQLPAVSTAIGAIPDVIVDGVTGLLIRDSSDAALAEALEKILADRTFASALARAARRHCLARFSIDAVAAEWDALLKHVTKPV